MISLFVIVRLFFQTASFTINPNFRCPLGNFIFNYMQLRAFSLKLALFALSFYWNLCRQITPNLLIPIETTIGVWTEYSVGFMIDTSVPHSASIQISFPFQFDPRGLIDYSRCKLKRGTRKLAENSCSLVNRTFTIPIGHVSEGEKIIVTIGNILNPTDFPMSSNFVVEVLFKSVTVVSNSQFGKIPFTSPPTQSGTTLDVFNYDNILIDQGSSWVFQFTPSRTYPINTTIRFVFPEGFLSYKVQCNITGISDAALRSRVFPNRHVYDCLNINGQMSGSQEVILSGVVNPNYKMDVDSIQLHIMQPNSMIIMERIKMSSTIGIKQKEMNTSILIPNKYRNNSITYIFEINMDSNLQAGDYIKIEVAGNWTYFLEDSTFIEGINSDQSHTPKFEADYSWPTYSNLYIKNFSSILKSSQIAFYVSLRTPLTSNDYPMTISAFRSHGGLVQTYSQIFQINSTTGYIREMRMHPMDQTIKLPVGETGPLEITLGLRYNLPKTNVLTYGKFIIKITPNLPLPDVNINGVPKCYFYGDIEAKNCTYDDSNIEYTLITVFTPVDFNFQSSEIPFMVTTEGYIDPQYEGITIDTLVKRYHFHIQFYTDYREEPIPTEVIFGDWVPDSIPLTTFSCGVTSRAELSYDHLKCTFTTPSEDLNEPQFVHIFRLEFKGPDSWYWGWDRQLGHSSNKVHHDYPCLGYGDNLVADPYIKCDLITWYSGPYAIETSESNKWPYVNIYGFELLPAGSTITLEIPKIQRFYNSYTTQLQFSILEDTYGYQTGYITLYSQEITVPSTTYLYYTNDDYDDHDVDYTLTNPIINKVTNITLDSLDLTTTGVTHIIFEVDQTVFEDIGREHDIECGQHKCSKFNKPVQYFILYPSRTLNRIESLTFPFIITPDHSGQYEFRLRLYKSGGFIANWKFNISIQPEILAAPTFQFNPALESQTVLYPNTFQYFSIAWITINPLPSETSYIEVFLDNHFTLASDFCIIQTSALELDDRGIQCEVWVTQNKIIIQHLAKVSQLTDFILQLELLSVDTASSISPTVSIYTYYDQDVLVDKIENSPFTSTTISNTNLETFTNFDIENPGIVPEGIRKGYFGHLILNIKPRTTDSVTLGQTLLLTFTNDFYPYSNQVDLPMICKIKGVRRACTYTLNPFTVSIEYINYTMAQGSDNDINITTQYLEHNGIFHPANQGRYFIKAEIYNNTYDEDTFTYSHTTYEYIEQYIDIRPDPIKYFNVTFAHLDINLHNIFTFEFRTGSDVIPAYDDSASAGRIYIGFPTVNDANGNVFSSDLGYSSGLGTDIPCWFQSGTGFITPLAGKQLECRLVTSAYSTRHTFVQIINFDTVPADTNAKIIMAKIMNPSSKQIDINFLIKVTTINPSTREELPLYESHYNMFFNMLTSSITSRSEPDSTTIMFEAGAKVGDTGKYFNTIPYSNSDFSTGDWFIIDMNEEFPLEGNLIGCLPTFYEHCIVYKQVNWLAIKIGNTTLLDLQVYIDKLPTSISRLDTYYTAYTFKSKRWSETITYTIKANPRWLQLRGDITGFSFQVLGSHDKLNINQKNVDVLISFTVSHIISRGGSIQIQFPNNSTLVPSIKPHCRSAVTLGSALNGDPTGKPSTNIQGDVGCLIENDYSWIITSFDELPAGSEVKIMGNIDFPTIQIPSLGMGYVVTYSDAVTNSYANGRIIDYGKFNFPLEVNNKTWDIDVNPTMYRSEPLRVNHKGELKFKVNLAYTLQSESNGGYIDISLWKVNTMGYSGGFSGPTSNLVCKTLRLNNNQRYGCDVTVASGSPTNYYYYRLQTFEAMPTNTDLQFTLTTQNGDANEGINFPSSTGSYQVEITVKYSSSTTHQVSQPHFIEVYGPNFSILNFISTIDIPDEPNMILIELKPSNTIQTNEQLIIQIPTVGIDGTTLFQNDLGMGYSDYDDLVFDLYQSDISSMKCKVYVGDSNNYQPVKIVCSNFNIAILNTRLIKMGFWVRNPSSSKGLAIPVQIYSYDTLRARKDCWSMIEAAIRVLPTSASPISDLGNFACGSSQRQIENQDFSLTTRNARALAQNDLYILKFNFDLRKQQKFAGKFNYNPGLAGSGDLIYMRNCQTVLLRVGATPLSIITSGSSTINAKFTGVFYNPKIQLTSDQKTIDAYAVYIKSKECEKILHNDDFPDLVPREMSSPSFTLSTVRGNNYQGEPEDYEISFTYSTASTATDMSLVKKISIQFPPFSTYDMKFANDQCMGDISSGIEIKECFIDTSSYTMWLTPVIKTTYQNNDNFKVETKGFSIVNPMTSTSINKNQFVIRYYTWPDDQNEPALLPNSDDYTFFKADSTKITSSTISYTSNSYDKHDSLEIPSEVYVNEFLPSSSDLNTKRMKTPLEFSFKVMDSFSDLSAGSYEHLIRVTFSSYFSHETINQKSNDLYYYIPTCHLNGVRIHDCIITSGRIQMRFQQQLTSGTDAAVRFSVLNPKDAADDGFFLTNLANSVVTLPIQFYPYNKPNYYAEAEPFNTYYRISNVYPQLGIYEASVAFGTQVYAKLNYLQFTLKFSRSDINGLVLQIPIIHKDGTIIYNNPTLLGLQSGSDYPCSVGIDTNVYCYYEQGTTSGYGRPTRIYISKFAIQASDTLSLRMLFTNPDNIGVFPSFIFKAYGGSYSVPEIMGNEFMGSYEIIDPFKTYPNVNYYSSGSCETRPDKGLWNKQTSYRFYINQNQNSGSYVVLEWRLNHPTYGQISEYEKVDSHIVDYFTISDSTDNRILYLVKKLSNNYSGTSTSTHTFGYLRSKHFLHNSHKIYLMKKPSFSEFTCSVSSSWLNSNYIVNQYGTAAIQYLDLGDRLIDQNTWQYISVSIPNLGTLTSRLDDNDPADMILAIKFIQNRMFNYFLSSTECSIEDGVTSTNPLKPVTCELDTTNFQFIIKNISKFVGTLIKVYYKVRTWTSNVQGTKVEVRAYANSQSYALSGGWALFTSSTAAYNSFEVYYTQDLGYSQNNIAPTITHHHSQMFSTSWVDHTGYAKVNSMTDNQISVSVYKGNVISYDGANVHMIYFRFYMERYSFSGCTGVSLSGPRTYPGYSSCGASGRHFWVQYSFYTSVSGGFSWYWNSWETLRFTFNFNSIAGDVNNDPDYWYVTASVNWFKNYYYSSHSICGCSNRDSCCGYSCSSCCRSYYSCRWYYGYGTFVLTTRGDGVAKPPGYNLASSLSVDLLSARLNTETQLQILVNTLNYAVGPSYNSYLVFHFHDGAVFPNNNPFPDTRDADLGAYVDCKCLAGSSVSVSATSNYLEPECIRYIPAGMNPSVAVRINLQVGHSLRCFFPGFRVPSSTNQGQLNVDAFIRKIHYFHRYIPRSYHSRYARYNAVRSLNSYTQYTLNSNNIDENGYWSSTRYAYSYQYYDVNITGNTMNDPILYMSMYAPKPLSSFCSSGYHFCRAYTSFINRRYYLTAYRDAYTNRIRLSGNAYFPPSDDYNSAYYRTYIGWCVPSSRYYYYHKTLTRSTSVLAASAPSYSYTPSIFGSTLENLPSGFLITTNMNGRTLYSYKRDYGQFQGSFIKLIMSGFTTLYGCGATLSDRLISFSSPFFCKVVSSNQLQIRARKDIQMTGYLYITLFTSDLPSSINYKIYLYDKLQSSTQYGISVYRSLTFSRTKSGYNIQPSTNILWRKQAYKEYRVNEGPIRFTFKNNYQYVYDYASTSNSDGISVYYPGDIQNTGYYCILKQYEPEKKHFRTQYVTKCQYETTNKIRISSIPSHILQPEFYYEVVIYRNKNTVNGYIGLSASNYNLVSFTTMSSTGNSIVNRDVFINQKYQAAYPITLSYVYFLTKQAAATNSLFIEFRVGIAGSGFHYFEFEFDNLGLSNFEIDSGDQIPCSLNGDFSSVSGSLIVPICRGYAPELERDSPLIIRVSNIGSFSNPSTFKISFDEFNNPASQKLFLVPINVRIWYINRGNDKVYTSYFPSIYVSDSLDVAIPTTISGGWTMTEDNRGASSTHYTSITWPYSSNYNDISQKIVMKIHGGITCCQNYANFVLDDNRTSSTSLVELWKNTIANVTVYRTPSLSSSSTNLMIRNVKNPYPFQKDTYEQIKEVEILFYNSYKTRYVKQISQKDYSDYQQLSQMNVDNGFVLRSETRSFDYHQDYPMTYDIDYTFSLNSFAGRKLKQAILQFTSGVRSIERAELRYTASPYLVNPVLAVGIFRKASNNNWCLRISGLDENLYSTSQRWIIRMRFFPNANYIYYFSTTYAENGEVEFSNSGSDYLYGDRYNSSAYAPNKFSLYQQRYVKGYYELQRKYLYADTGLQTDRLAFRFTTPYTITELQTFDIKLQSASDIVPSTSNGKLVCVFQETIESKAILGSGLYSECSFSAANSMYSISVPKGGLLKDTEYTISIKQQAQLVSLFNMPETPKHYELSFIYNSELGLQFGDTFDLDFIGLLKSFSVNHRFLRYTNRNFIGFTFKPRFTLPAASLTTPVTQSVLQIQLQSRYFASCLQVEDIFNDDSTVFQSGAYFSHYSSPAVPNANTRILCGQYTESYTPVKLRVTDYSNMNADSTYYFRFPLIKNPTSIGAPLVYKIRLLSYENSQYHPKVIGYYEYNSLEQTVQGTSSWQYIRWYEDNGDIVQNNVGLSIAYYTYRPPINSQVIVKFRNNAIKAFTSLSALTSLSNSNYGHYEFYPNINLCLFKKTTTTNDGTISLGTHPTSIDAQSYVIQYVHTYQSQSLIETSNFNIGSQDGTYGSGGSVSATLRYSTGWSYTDFSRLTGVVRTNSVGTYKITFRSDALEFPERSYMLITLDSEFSIENDECKQISGFLPGSSYATSNLICRKQSSTVIRIAGYNHISPGTTLSVTLYLQIAYNSLSNRSPNARIIVYSVQSKKIIDAQTSSVALNIGSYGSYDLSLKQYNYQELREDTALQFDISFKLASHTLSSGSYIALNFGNWTIDPATTGGQVIWKYKVGSNIYWVPSQVTNPSANIYHLPVYSNYSMIYSQTIVIRVRHQLPDSLYGIYFPHNQWSYISIQAYNSADTRLEHQYKRVWIQPYMHTSLEVQPVLKYINAVTMYEFTFTPNISASAGDIISIEFTTTDGLIENLYDETLGRTIEQNDTLAISCHQSDHVHIISDDRMKCQLFKGDKEAAFPVPAVIQIPITKDIAANTEIKFTVLNLMNPEQSNYPIGITAKLMNFCVNGDINNPCTYYKSTKYIQFDPPASQPSFITHGSLSFSPNLVSAINTGHTFTGSVTVNAGDYLKIIYFPEISIPQVCSITSGNGICYSYPLQNTILIKATSTQSSSYSFTLGGMTNLFRTYKVTFYPKTYIWNAAAGTIRSQFQTNNFWTNHITQDPASGDPLQITFTPTLTPDYQLKYNFNNIARIEISYLLQNQFINLIYVTAGSEITFVTEYCNATLQSDASEATPYPYRFECYSIGTRTLYLRKQDNFPAWTPDFINKKVIIYLKYRIADGQFGNSNAWKAYTYTSTSVNNEYKVSEAIGTFPIIDYKSPYIYKINFPTQAFSKRTCRTNQLCMFYGYLLPSSPQSPMAIDYMTYTLPSEFGYSNQVSYNCKIENKNDDNNPVSCTTRRVDSDIIIKFVPTYYDHVYELVTIDLTDRTKLFQAPKYPGTHYQMKVDLYSQTNLLMESMMVNLTTVYGELLEYPQIYVLIPLDAEARGLFEFKFRVGAEDILPGYENNANNRITSAIEFQFSKSFEDDLGTQKFAGQEVACLPISGITVYSTGKLTCKIYPSVSTITYPQIIVTGYDRIRKNTDVIIRIADLKTLPTGAEDYIKIGVSLTYYNYGGVKGYIYEPTGFVVGGTTPAITPIPLTLTITESSSNFVGELVNYTFTGTLGSGASTITSEDFVGVRFQENVFEGFFSQNLKAICSLATNGKCESYGLSSIIYFQPASDITASSLIFNINNMINSAFTFEYVNITFEVFTVVDLKVDVVGTASITKFSKPSSNISALITTTDSSYGGDSLINYYLQFQMNHNLPKYGMIMIQLPQVYDSLFDLNSQCILASSFDIQSTCEIINSHLVVIRPNGVFLLPEFAYDLTLTNMTNPNLKLTGHTFKITSSFNDDVYSPKIISISDFESPDISVVDIKTCDTFQVSLSAYNAFYDASYEINLICASYIKEASEIEFYLSWDPSEKEDSCSSLTNSLYSYDCSVQKKFKEGQKKSYLTMYLQGIAPQEMIALSSSIQNGEMGTYQLNVQISYKGFTYIEATSNEFFIKSADVMLLENTDISFNNYPINRNYDSIYTTRIPSPSKDATELMITLPSEFDLPEELQLTCYLLDQNFSQTYINLLKEDFSSEVPCSVKNKVITVGEIGQTIKNLTSQEFLRIAFFKLKNSDISTTNSRYNISFINSETDSGTIVSTGIVDVPSHISDPPLNIQINNITLSSTKFMVKASYIFSISTTSSAQIRLNRRTKIALIITFPSQYQEVLERIEQSTNITTTFQNSEYTTSSSLSGLKLITQYLLTSQVSSSQFTLRFDFPNPSVSLNCESETTYTVTLFNVDYNSIISETIANNINCPDFNDRLFIVNVTGKNRMEEGTIEEYTISIQKPSLFLNITPVVSTPAITVQPTSIIFRGYKTKVEKFKLKVSNALEGEFQIRFIKEEKQDIFYNQIPAQNISVILSDRNYSITFTSIDTQSVGIPIPLYITLEMENTRELTLLYTHNCSTDYVFQPLSFLTIPAGTEETQISLAFIGSNIEPMCVIDFQISSLTSSQYYLPVKRLYISASTSIYRSERARTMRLRVSPQMRQSENVGSAILDSAEEAVAPQFYSLVETEIGSNSASFMSAVSQNGIVYFAVMEIGTNRNKISQEEIYSQNLSTGVYYGSSRTTVNNAISTIQATLTVLELSSQTTYLMGAYVNCSTGISDIIFEVFHTNKASNGAAIKMQFKSIYSDEEVIQAMMNVLRIDESRITVLTVTSLLGEIEEQYIEGIMNSRSFVYEIVVGPNPSDQSTPPVDMLQELIDSQSMKDDLLQFLPDFDTAYQMSVRQIILAKPRFRDEGGQIVAVTYESAKLKAYTWESSNITAVIVPQPTQSLLAIQVASGYDQDNNPLDQQHIFTGITDQEGSIQFEFTLLSSNKSYSVFIEAESIVPYPTPLRVSDDEVKRFQITTSPDLNSIGSDETIVESLAEKHPEMAAAVSEQIKRISKKKSVAVQDPRTAYRNGRKTRRFKKTH